LNKKIPLIKCNKHGFHSEWVYNKTVSSCYKCLRETKQILKNLRKKERKRVGDAIGTVWEPFMGLLGKDIKQIKDRFFNKFKEGAYKRGYKFKIEISDIEETLKKQKNKCILSGRSFLKHRMSIDRRDNNKGYLKENIQLVTTNINMSKHKLNNSNFIKLCHDVIKTHQKKKPIK
jgi:hypothetical protein